MTDISIVVPIYNAEKYLNKCLDSLINQTKKELEFILINDGSTDDSEKIITSYHDKRIKYFKNKNQGIGKTRNFGIEKATGKYLMFLDSDDYLSEETCELLYQKAEKRQADLIVFDYSRVEKNNLNKVRISAFTPTNIKENKELLLKINLGPCNKIYKTALIKDNNIKFEENLKVNEFLHYYTIHEKSETTVRDERVFDILKIVSMIRSYLKKDKSMKEISDKLTVKILTNYTIQQRYQSDKKVAINFINKAFSYLKEEVPDYKKNKYYENRVFLRRTIEKSSLLTKIYCVIYR